MSAKPLTLRGLLLTLAAAFPVVGGVWAGAGAVRDSHADWVRSLVAQEAERLDRAKSVQIQYLVDAERRREDRRLTGECRLTKTEERCKLESDVRWKQWQREDCILDAQPENEQEAVRVCGPVVKELPPP